MSKTSDMVAATKFMMNYNNSEKNKYTRILEKMDYIKKENKFLLKIAFSTKTTFVNLNTTSPYLRRERRSYYRTLYFDELIRNMERLSFNMKIMNGVKSDMVVGYPKKKDIDIPSKIQTLEGFPAKLEEVWINNCPDLKSFGKGIEYIRRLNLMDGCGLENLNDIPLISTLYISLETLKNLKDVSGVIGKVTYVRAEYNYMTSYGEQRVGTRCYEPEDFIKAFNEGTIDEPH